MLYAKVAVEASNYAFDAIFDYIVPPELETQVLPGCRVKIPFGAGNRLTLGIVFEVTENTDAVKLKSIDSVIDAKPLLNEEMLLLIKAVKDRTFCTYYDAAKVMIPSGINYRVIKSYAVNPECNPAKAESLTGVAREFFDYLSSKSAFVHGNEVFKALSVKPDISIPDTLLRKGLIIEQADMVRNLNDATKRMIRLSSEETEVSLSPKQKEIVRVLKDIGTATVKELCYFTGLTPAVANALVKKGVAEFYEAPVEYTTCISDVEGVRDEIRLTDEQNAAYEKLCALAFRGERSTSLLYGVTGSGKTSVYMKTIDRVLDSGRTVMVLVPEIGLTPQALSLFTRRYGKEVAVFHSALSLRERTEQWKKVKEGKAGIVIGTRSAVFAPLENIGLIIVDEEQEHTYKSEQTPRYDAVEIAKIRSGYHKCLLVLASATPSVETYASAVNKKIEMCTLAHRYGKAELPDVITVDMRTAEKMPACREISKQLYEALEDNLRNGEQSILLINRRGYNTFAVCEECGNVITCPDCSISMTYHTANGRLMCHYCGRNIPFTGICPTCSEPAVKYAGFGTQKIEDEIHQLLPEARILRVDADTTSGKDSHEKLLSAFGNGEYDIMVGTQMVAKGLDFPNVTLVGVVSIDQQLYNDDFRSLEKTFSLLTQVVGRSGRGNSKGRAVIQTLTPENEIIRIAARQDYNEFFDSEITIRKCMVYPPYCDLCVFGFVGKNEAAVKNATTAVLAKLKELSEGKEKVIALMPVPARVSKISGKYRYRLIVKCRNSAGFRQIISKILMETGKEKQFRNVTVYADINPDTML